MMASRRFSMSSGDMPSSWAFSVMLSAAGMSDAKPTLMAIGPVGRPRTWTVPWSGRYRPFKTLTSVDLPDWRRPITPMASPDLTVNEMSVRARSILSRRVLPTCVRNVGAPYLRSNDL